MRTKRFRQIIPSFSDVSQLFNGEWKFISGDYSCGVAGLLPVGKHKTAVSLHPTHVILSSNTTYGWIYSLKERVACLSLQIVLLLV